MRSLTLAALVLASLILSVRADISLPVKDTFYDKIGRGFSNIAAAPAEMADSTYMTLQTDGSTVAASKGMAQGIGRMFCDMGLGIYDVITSPFPTGPNWSYRTWKQPPHGEMVVKDYPPADLMNNWY